MRTPTLRKFPLVFLLISLACPPAYADGQEQHDGVKHHDARRDAYYSIYPDRRLCIFPLCGGYWIYQVNHKLTRCSDGTLQQACYVAEIDWSAIDLERDAGATLVLGKLRSRNYPGFGRFGVLIPDDAWRPATLGAPEGTWYGLKDNGIICISEPCYNIEERVLNRRATQTVSGVDLSQVEADPEDLEAAYAALMNDELIAVGNNRVVRDEGPAGDGLTMVASQFYLKLGSDTQDDLFCATVDDCTLTVYHSYVESPDECYCLLCPVPLNVDAAIGNERSWLQNCQDFGYPSDDDDLPDQLICPAIRCIAPQPVACVDNQCVFQEPELIPLP